MLLEFKTKGNNTYHRRKYLAIDTEAMIYSTECSSFVMNGIEIKESDRKELIAKCERLEYKKVEYAF